MFKKLLSLVLVLTIGFFRIAAFSIAAQELEAIPTPVATEAPVVEVSNTENQTEVNNLIDSTSETGDNLIETVTPTPTPTESPVVVTSPLVEELIGTEVESLVPTESPSPSPTPEVASEIVTSDSVSETEVTNNVNVNEVNSEIINHTLNIYLGVWVGDIDLSTLTGNAINKVYGEDQKLDGEISLEVSTIDNFTYIDNNVSSVSDTGSNEINSSGGSQINTGDAYSIVSVLNNVNVNVIDSKIHVVTVNIFGEITGNILLPNPQSSSCESCNLEINTASNTTIINNNIGSNSTSGENTISLSEDTNSSEITTGDAKSAVNVLNVVNNTYLNTFFEYLYINNQGEWVGNFLGWSQETAPSCSEADVSLIQGSNTTTLNNLVTSEANTGDNKIQSSESSEVVTGNAYSSVSVVNLVNSNFINSRGFIGFINIFGRLIGDIGSASLFEEEKEEQKEETSEENNNSDESNKKEEGGYLEVRHSNNVGTHILPGDTLTFFVDIKNPGFGKVYETTLTIELFKNGISYGGFNYYVGDVPAQNTLRFVTGLVMSDQAESGEYTAIASVKGIIGPKDDSVSATSESKFKIAGFVPATLVSSAQAFEADDVLGESSVVESGSNFGTTQIIWIFLGLLVVYVFIKVYQKRKKAKNMLI